MGKGAAIRPLFRWTCGTAALAVLAHSASAADVFVALAPGDRVPGDTTETFVSFGPPAADERGQTAFRALLSSGSEGIYRIDGEGSVEEVTRRGANAPDAQGDSTPAQFSVFGEPIIADGQVTFAATALPSGAGGIRCNGIWSGRGGSLVLVACEGDPVPGVSGATFGKFLAVGANETTGPVVLAQVKGVPPSADTGIWASSGQRTPLQLVLREGDSVTVGPSAKTVASLQFLTTVAGVQGQTRGFGRGESIAVRATFTDKSDAIVTISPALPAQQRVSVFDPGTWPRTDAELGIEGHTIEDFEDTALVTGLQAQVLNGGADYAATGTVPNVFDGDTDDPNVQKALLPGIWDGTRFFSNRRDTPVPLGYTDSQWADPGFLFPAGTTSVGFSLEQLEIAGTFMTVTTQAGSQSYLLQTLPGFSVSSGRNGYLKIDAGPGEEIQSVVIDNQGGDGYAIDHLAFRTGAGLSVRRSRAARGDIAPGADGAAFAALGTPHMNDAGNVAFRGVLVKGDGVTKKLDTGIWHETSSGISLVAREGDAAPGTDGFFAKFGDPVGNAFDAVAFLAKARGVKSSEANGIWLAGDGSVVLVARQGDDAPGTPEGTPFKSFFSAALTDRGVAFVARLGRAPGVTRSNALGVWFAVPGFGTELVLRQGDTVMVGEPPVAKTIRTFDVLGAAGATSGQQRSFDRDGDLITRVVFTDRTDALLFIRTVAR